MAQGYSGREVMIVSTVYEYDSRTGDSQAEGADGMAGIAHSRVRNIMWGMAFFIYYCTIMVCVAEYYSFCVIFKILAGRC